MIIDDIVFKELMAKLSKKTVNPVNWKYTGQFIDSTTLKTFKVINVTEVDTLSDYREGISDRKFVRVQLQKSIYLQLLQVNRRLLKFQLIKSPNSLTSTVNIIAGGKIENYDAYLTKNTSESLETRSGKLDNRYTDDLGELVDVHVNLVEKGLSEFRLWDIGGVYRNFTVENLLKGLYSQPLKAFGDTMTIGYATDLYPADNVEIQYQRLIPSGIRLVDLPGWLQNNVGVYQAGLGYYLNQGTWYFYPLYDFTRYTKAKKRATIINVPQNEMMGLTTSYYTEGEETYIFATGRTKHIDLSDRHLDNTGTGFRIAKTGNLMDKFSVNESGHVHIPKGRNMVSVSYEQRDGELSNIKTNNGLFTSNPWYESSQVMAGMGNLLSVVWEYSNPDLIYPGMPIKLIYKHLGTPYSIFGTVINADTKVSTPMHSVADNRYVSKTSLVLFIERATR